MGNILNLWWTYIKLNVAKWAEYRADFIIGIVAMALTNVMSVVFFWAIFSHITVLNGWSFGQVLFLTGFGMVTFGIWHVWLVGPAPWRVEREIRMGTFDRLLVRPVNVLTHLIISNIDDDGFGDLTSGIIVLIVASGMLKINWTLGLLGTFALLLAGSVLVLFSISLMLSTVSFWSTRSRSIGDIFFTLMKFTEYPLEIYTPIITFGLTFVLPFGFISYYPAQLFIGRGIWMSAAWLTPIVGIILFAIAYTVWNIGIKNYSSVGH